MSKPLWGRSKNSFADTEPASTLPMALPGEEQAFAPTVPQPLMRVREPGHAVARSSVHDLMAEIRKDNRVCPQPQRWLEFYRLLQDLAEGAALPSPPLVGHAWEATPALAKRMCFREQVEWAVANDRVIAAFTFLKVLPRHDWHCMA